MKKKFGLLAVFLALVFTLASCGVKEHYSSTFAGEEGSFIYMGIHNYTKNYYSDGVTLDFNYAHDIGVVIDTDYIMYFYNPVEGLGQLFEVKKEDIAGDDHIIGNVEMVNDRDSGYEYGASNYMKCTFTTEWTSYHITDDTVLKRIFSTDDRNNLTFIFMAPVDDTVSGLDENEIVEKYATVILAYSYRSKYIKII